MYFPNRQSDGFVMVRTFMGSGYRLTIEPATNAQYRLNRISSLAKPAKKFKIPFELADKTVVMKEVWDWTGILQIKLTSGLEIPVLTVINHVPLIGRAAKQNFQLAPPPAAPPLPTLSPFVARQLLELAQLKRDLCPITVEEFAVGDTAVLPCGHLFTRLAMTESFKAAPNKCPACRVVGTPVYV